MNTDTHREALTHLQSELSTRMEKIKVDVSKKMEADFSEQATQQENSEVLEALYREAEDELTQIEQAMGRIDSGSYGICVDCGDEISNERLEAIPYASACKKCA